MPFATHKHDSHSRGRGRVQRSTNQSMFVVSLFVCSLSTQEFVTETPFFCNLLLKTLFAADAAGRAWSFARLSDNTCDRKRHLGYTH